MAVFPHQFFQQGIANALNDSAMHLSLDTLWIDGTPNVVSGPDFLNHSLAGHCIDIHDGPHGPKNIDAQIIKGKIRHLGPFGIKARPVEGKGMVSHNWTPDAIEGPGCDFPETRLPVRSDNPDRTAYFQFQIILAAFQHICSIIQDSIPHFHGRLHHSPSRGVGDTAGRSFPIIWGTVCVLGRIGDGF